MAAAKKTAAVEREAEVKTITYLPAGVAPDVQRDEPSIDPELEKIRDEEIKANEVDISGTREEPTIADELVKEREAELKADAKRAKDAGVETKVQATSASADSTKAPAKKSSK